MLFDYDDTNIDDIYRYAKQLINKQFKDIFDDYATSNFKTYQQAHNPNKYSYQLSDDSSAVTYKSNTKAKGQIGNWLEEYYFGYKPNSNQEADFNKVGLELKATPIDLTKNNEYRAGERLSITMISYNEPVQEDFYQSHLWDKIKQILLIHYIRDRQKERQFYRIKFVSLFTPNDKDLLVIKSDYALINNKIKSGNAHLISEGDTMYLGACTKGSTAEKSLVPQFYNKNQLAKRRNFCFKQSYMTYVLNNYVINNHTNDESILSTSQLHENSFEENIKCILSKFNGKSVNNLASLYNLKPTSKSINATLVYRLLGIKGNKAEEFEKANIVIKTIRVENTGTIKESMSFPCFKIKELVNQTWEESDLYNQFASTKFLFVIFKEKEENVYYLDSAKFWNMPYSDLEILEKEWQTNVDIFKEGIELTYDFKRKRMYNNLPDSKDTQICHIRPHAQKAAYRLTNGFNIGNLSDADELPDGQFITKQCFFLNSKYIRKIINDD